MQNDDVLRGLKIIVTRPKESAGSLSEPLRDLGADIIEVPVIRFGYPEDIKPLDEAVSDMLAGKYDWVIFTSVNGVKFTWEKLAEKGYQTGQALQSKIAAIGPATASALTERGLDVDYVPEIYVAEEIAAGLGDVENEQILLPRADIARKALPNLLRDSGALVNEVIAYRTIEADPDSEELAEVVEMLDEGLIDWVTFTSSSTVVHFLELMRRAGVGDGVLKELKAACIGPITEQTARELNLDIGVVAKQHDIPGLVDALVMAVSADE